MRAALSERGRAVGGGLLNLPALFALADFHVFSVIYAALSCTEMTSLAVQSAPINRRVLSLIPACRDGIGPTGVLCQPREL